MTTQNSPKIATDFHCEYCNYKCSKQSDWNKHIRTRKHKRTTNNNIYNNIKSHDTIKCLLCDKMYSDRVALWRHKKICKGKEHITDDVPTEIDMNNRENTLDVTLFMELLKQNQDFKQLLIEQQSENKMFKELIIEQQNENQKLQSQLIDAVKDTGNTVNNITTNNNQKFNLNFFLNTTCKDAMNMSEFIENIEVNFKDIENIGKNGYVSGMTDMILSRIKELDVTKRPMHCTDLKRETMYIKDNNEWTKDTPENTKFHQMIDCVAKQNYAKMPLWRQRNPECLDSDHPKYDFCIKMMRNMLGDVGMEQIRLDNKVIKNLSRHILVEKN